VTQPGAQERALCAGDCCAQLLPGTNPGAILVANSPVLNGQDTTKAVFPTDSRIKASSVASVAPSDG
jgi:hypothetical protein